MQESLVSPTDSRLSALYAKSPQSEKIYAIALFSHVQAAIVALSQKDNFQTGLSNTIDALRKAVEEAYTFIAQAMKGKGANLLLAQLEFLEKGQTYDLGPT